MLKERIASNIIEIVGQNFGKSPNELTLEKSLRNDLRMDSLDSLELLMRIEDEFDLKFNEDDITKIDTLADLMEYIICVKTPSMSNQ